MKKDLEDMPFYPMARGENVTDCWIYEEPSGLDVFATITPITPHRIRTDTRIVKIPVSRIRAYLRRLDKGRVVRKQNIYEFRYGHGRVR